jgi:prepilin-type N-terminal cleavage/methylation domain-containing protein
MISRLHRQERGFTLVEVLIAAVLMLVVLSATLAAFNGASNLARGNALQNDQMDQLRPAMDRLITQLRNVANPTTTSASINYVDNYRAVFLTTDPSRRWVSYCLNRTSPTNELLYYQTSTATTIQQQSSATPCPSTTTTNGNPDWAQTIRLSNNITNDLDSSHPRAVFTYYSGSGTIDASAGLNVSSTSPPVSRILRIGVTLYLDINAALPPAPDKSPRETSLQSGAYLRNQNQPPTARFTALRGGGNAFTLDGSDSSDPEGRNLQYFWYETATAPTSSAQVPADPLAGLPNCDTTTTATFGGLTWKCLGVGVILSHDFSGDLPTNVWLMVVDPGNLIDLSKQPGTFGACLSSTNAARLETQCEALP